MLNVNIHKGLENAEIRDFLAKSLGDGYPGEVEFLEKHISELQERLVNAQRSEAARQLIAQNGWEYLDVSDDIKDFKSGEYFPFVGTKSEMFGQGLGESTYERPSDEDSEVVKEKRL